MRVRFEEDEMFVMAMFKRRTVLRQCRRYAEYCLLLKRTGNADAG